MRNKFFYIIFALLLWGVSLPAWGRELSQITDWYIKDFYTEIELKEDSSVVITEKIVADCGNVPGKHGIFRVLPVLYNNNGRLKIEPVKLLSITDFRGNALPYSTSSNLNNITWKIGDPDIEVKGENEYLIKYAVKNATDIIEDKMSWIWDVLGVDWELEIDNFRAKVILPVNFKKDLVDVRFAVGKSGVLDVKAGSYDWENDHTLVFASNRKIFNREGFTAFLTFPKGIIKQPAWLDIYGIYILLGILPIVFMFAVCFWLWRRYGDDPSGSSVIMPEYEPPENLSPMILGYLQEYGRFSPKFITAGIIDLAVKGLLTIEEKEGHTLGIIRYKQVILRKKENKKAFNKLDESYRLLYSMLPFGVAISGTEAKKKFIEIGNKVTKAVKEDLCDAGYLDRQSLKVTVIMGAALGLIFIGGITFFQIITGSLPAFVIFVSAIMNAMILGVFVTIMPRRTEKGVKLMDKVKGFKMYMGKAESTRQQFYEKEGIWEKLLPYAIMFGLTGKWIQIMHELYLEKGKTIAIPWYSGGDIHNIDSFVSRLNNIASSLNSTSGSGHGGSGGGGGGGGGGGW